MIGAIALLTVTLTFVFTMNLKAADIIKDKNDDSVEQICCKEEFTNEICYIHNGKRYKGKHVPC